MNLYLLNRIGGCGYDEYYGFVVRAESAEMARYIASQAHGDEGTDVWLDPKSSTCVGIQAYGETGVILSSYRSAT